MLNHNQANINSQPNLGPHSERFDEKLGRKVIVKDYSNQQYQEKDEKDFHVRTTHDERLIDTIIDEEDQNTFETDMMNRGDQDDLPDSDKSLDCQARGIDKKTCFGKDDIY